MNIFKSRSNRENNPSTRNKSSTSEKPKISPATVEHYIKGIQLPVSKDEMISYAQENEAPDDIVHLLEEMVEGIYSSPIDIAKEIGRLRPRRKTPTGPSPSKVEHYIKGIHFPVSKENLIRHAQQNDAPYEIIELLERMKDDDFRSPIDISKEIGRLKNESAEPKKGVTSAEVKRYLKGLEYPVNKGDIIFHAQDKNAPLHLLSALDTLSEEEYETDEHLWDELNQLTDD